MIEPIYKLDGYTFFFKSLLCVYLICTVGNAFSQNIDFLPQDKPSIFKNIDTNGYLYLVQNIGTVYSRQKVSIPLHIRFNSSHKEVSPYVGYGWKFPLLECRFFPKKDNLYQMNTIQGGVCYFFKTKQDPSKLAGWHGTFGQFKKDGSVEITSSRTKEIFLFKDGRLVSYKKPNCTLTFKYKNGIIAGIYESQKPLLRISKSTEKDAPSVIEIMPEDNSWKMTLKTIMRAQTFDQKGKIGKIMVPSLSQVLYDGEVGYQYDYSLDSSGNPKMTAQLFNGKYDYVWNARTQHVLRTENYQCKIKPTTAESLNAEIERKHDASPFREYWHENKSKGLIITEFQGYRQVKTHYVSGKLAGLLRSDIIYHRGKKHDSQEFSYDENRRLLRVKLHHKPDMIYLYEPDGREAGIVYDGDLIREYTPNALKLVEPYLKKSDSEI